MLDFTNLRIGDDDQRAKDVENDAKWTMMIWVCQIMFFGSIFGMLMDAISSAVYLAVARPIPIIPYTWEILGRTVAVENMIFWTVFTLVGVFCRLYISTTTLFVGMPEVETFGEWAFWAKHLLLNGKFNKNVAYIYTYLMISGRADDYTDILWTVGNDPSRVTVFNWVVTWFIFSVCSEGAFSISIYGITTWYHHHRRLTKEEREKNGSLLDKLAGLFTRSEKLSVPKNKPKSTPKQNKRKNTHQRNKTRHNNHSRHNQRQRGITKDPAPQQAFQSALITAEDDIDDMNPNNFFSRGGNFPES